MRCYAINPTTEEGCSLQYGHNGQHEAGKLRCMSCATSSHCGGKLPLCDCPCKPIGWLHVLLAWLLFKPRIYGNPRFRPQAPTPESEG